MKVEIYTVVRNSEYIQDMYLKHYKTNFPGCTINIYNNHEDPKVIDRYIAEGCNIMDFPDYKIYQNEFVLTEHKNTIWKNSTADWVIICDVDELVQITSEDLSNIGDIDGIVFKSYHMINVESVKDMESYRYGWNEDMYDKLCMFKPTVEKVRYSHGAHKYAWDDKKNNISKLEYDMFHYTKKYFTKSDYYEWFSNIVKEGLLHKRFNKYYTDETNNRKISDSLYDLTQLDIEKVR